MTVMGLSSAIEQSYHLQAHQSRYLDEKRLDLHNRSILIRHILKFIYREYHHNTTLGSNAFTLALLASPSNTNSLTTLPVPGPF